MDIRVKHYGEVKNEKFISANRELLRLSLKQYDGKKVYLTIHEFKTKRSLSQNAYLHVLLTLLSDYCGYDNIEETKDAMKMMFLKVQYDDKPPTVRRTRDLSTKELNEFIDKIRRFCLQECFMRLPEPGEIEFN